jgi:4-diphosphocytidyl-2-C-methyl-D-erythritol kinase
MNNRGITVFAPAKVNFYLQVIRKRQDGYHDIVSVMQALELADEIVINPAGDGVRLTCDDPGLPTGEENIAYRAAISVIKESGKDLGVEININKRIPVAAGLGGGSSDAAATLKGINLLFGLGIPAGRLREIGRSLGADVPFFLSWPSARAEGVGEVLTELPPPEETWIILVNPGFGVSTRWVYESLNLGLTNNPNNITLPPFMGPAYDAGLLVSYLRNDLERVTASRHPQIEEIKRRLVEEGALAAMMSGSGPTTFGIFSSRADAEAAAGRLAGHGWKVIVTKTISAWPEPIQPAGAG